MRLIIHAGMPKAGSTTLQDLLARHDAALRGLGVLYPRAGRHRNAHSALFLRLLTPARLVALDVKPLKPLPAAFSSYVQELRDEIAATRPHAVILSDEGLAAYWSVDELVALRDALAFDDVYILVLVRRQEDHVASAYAQVTKGVQKSRLTPRAYLEAARVDPFYDYDGRIRDVERAFGEDRVVVRWLHDLEGDLVAPLAAMAGFRADPGWSGAPSNVRPSWLAVRLLRLLNAAGLAKRPIRRLVVGLDKRLVAGRLRSRLDARLRPFPPAALAEFAAAWSHSNARLTARKAAAPYPILKGDAAASPSGSAPGDRPAAGRTGLAATP